MTDAQLAARLAQTAGMIARAVRDDATLTGAALGAAGDATANTFLVSALRHARPADGVLSEEAPCDGTRLTQPRVWIVDPVDGTREFAEARDDWAVHVALAIDGVACVGAVALPDLGLVLRSDQPLARAPVPARPRIVVSRTRPPLQASAVAAALDAEVVAMGSAGAKAMAVVRGVADIYLHAGGQHEWDSAAPVAVAVAAGLHASRLDGSPLRYNNADTFIPDLLICRPELAARVLAIVA